eukprot:1823380-Pleurochrysis_carterae.AAC.1
MDFNGRTKPVDSAVRHRNLKKPSGSWLLAFIVPCSMTMFPYLETPVRCTATIAVLQVGARGSAVPALRLRIRDRMN